MTTTEETEIQTLRKALHRAYDKIEHLEKTVGDLERRLTGGQSVYLVTVRRPEF